VCRSRAARRLLVLRALCRFRLARALPVATPRWLQALARLVLAVRCLCRVVLATAARAAPWASRLRTLAPLARAALLPCARALLLAQVA